MKNLNNYIGTSQTIDESLAEEKSNEILEALKTSDIDEGFLGTVLGGLAGMTAGASVMKAVCKGLGIKDGMLYNLLTSKMVCAAVGAAIGNNL